MKRTQRVTLVCAAVAVAFLATWLPLRASETIDYDGINKIKAQGLNLTNSKGLFDSIKSSVARCSRISPRATASRSTTGLAETSTIRAWPRESRWVSFKASSSIPSRWLGCARRR